MSKTHKQVSLSGINELSDCGTSEIIEFLVMLKTVLQIVKRIKYFTESVKRMECKVDGSLLKIKNVRNS